MSWQMKLELLIAGGWLGVSQVGLAFHLLFCQGGTIIFYFLLLAAWLTGSAIGLFLSSKRTVGISLLIVGGILYGVVAQSTRVASFELSSLATILFAILVVSSFAGWILQSRSLAFKNVRLVMLHENNGFILGYAVAWICLFLTLDVIDYLSLVLALILLLLLSCRNEKSKQYIRADELETHQGF